MQLSMDGHDLIRRMAVSLASLQSHRHTDGRVHIEYCPADIWSGYIPKPQPCSPRCAEVTSLLEEAAGVLGVSSMAFRPAKKAKRRVA